MKAIEDGKSLVDKKPYSEKLSFGYYERVLADTVVVKKSFLEKIIEEWHPNVGEVTLAKFLLGKDPEHYWLKKAVDNVERD